MAGRHRVPTGIRNWSASITWSAVTWDAPARSAMVRATRLVLTTPRALIPYVSPARRMVARFATHLPSSSVALTASIRSVISPESSMRMNTACLSSSPLRAVLEAPTMVTPSASRCLSHGIRASYSLFGLSVRVSSSCCAHASARAPIPAGGRGRGRGGRRGAQAGAQGTTQTATQQPVQTAAQPTSQTAAQPVAPPAGYSLFEFMVLKD